MAWGSFWDGIQLIRLDSTMHIAKGEQSRTIARRYSPTAKNVPANPTSKYAGTNAIEAPFIYKHGGWYYLFVAWDYCCRGSLSNYRVAVGRSRTVDGPYLDRNRVVVRSSSRATRSSMRLLATVLSTALAMRMSSSVMAIASNTRAPAYSCSAPYVGLPTVGLHFS